MCAFVSNYSGLNKTDVQSRGLAVCAAVGGCTAALSCGRAGCMPQCGLGLHLSTIMWPLCLYAAVWDGVTPQHYHVAALRVCLSVGWGYTSALSCVRAACVPQYVLGLHRSTIMWPSGVCAAVWAGVTPQHYHVAALRVCRSVGWRYNSALSCGRSAYMPQCGLGLHLSTIMCPRCECAAVWAGAAPQHYHVAGVRV